MIVDHQNREVIFTPPHTASRSLSYAYQARPECQVIHGPNPEGRFDHHFCGVHSEWEDYTKIVIVRDPYARLVGLWFHLCEYHTYNGYGSPSFEDYIKKCVTKPTDLYWLYWWPISELLRYYKVSDAKTSTLQEFVTKRSIELPIQPATFRKPDISAYWTQELKELVNRFYYADFELVESTNELH